jgi:hypothetical protein
MKIMEMEDGEKHMKLHENTNNSYKFIKLKHNGMKIFVQSVWPILDCDYSSKNKNNDTLFCFL